jgi:hypothetical protein
MNIRSVNVGSRIGHARNNVTLWRFRLYIAGMETQQCVIRVLLSYVIVCTLRTVALHVVVSSDFMVILFRR